MLADARYVQGPKEPPRKCLPVVMKEVRIKDFKNIKTLSLKLSQLNDIFGKNKTGKTSILEAIQFCMEGKKADVSKIRIGAEKAKVELDILEGETQISISTSINKAGTVTCKVKANGITHNQPRTLIKRLVSFGTFNPRTMLEKEGRLSRLLSLIPIKITEKDLSIPEMKINKLPLSDPNGIDYNEHAYNVLQSVEKDLRHTRLMKGREKDMVRGAYQKRKEDFSNSCMVFNQNYNKDPLNITSTFEDEVRDQGRLTSDEKSIGEKKLRNDELISNNQKDLDTIKRNQSFNIGMLKACEDKLLKVKKDKENLETNEKRLKSQMEIAKKNIADLREERKSIDQEHNEVKDKLSKCTHKINMARESQKLLEQCESLKKDQKEVEQKEKKWQVFDMLCKKAIPALRKKILEPISKSIPGLKVEEDHITYKGVSLDELSGSEVVELSIKLMSIENKSNLLFINEAECLDSDSIKGIDFKNFSSVIIARVADKPLGGEWKSIEQRGKDVESNKKVNPTG